MTDESGVAPETIADESEMLTLGDIAEASGVSKFFDNASNEQSDESENINQEDLPDPDPIPEEPLEEPEVQEPVAETLPEVSEEDSVGIKKRIGKLIEAREEAKQEAERLKARVEELEKPNPETKKKPKGLEKLDEIYDLQTLQAREEDAEHLHEWLLQNPEGGVYTDQAGEDHDVDYDGAKKLIVDTHRDLHKNFKIVKDRLQEKVVQDTRAKTTFKWLEDKQSPEFYHLSQILSNNEHLNAYSKRDPHAMVVLGYAIEGFKKVEMDNKQKEAKTQVTPPAPQVPVAPSRSASVVRKKQTSSKDLLSKARSGEINDAVSYLESIL